ncbi:MAG: phosphoribosyl-ATP diphosphatase [Alphaproteobacteria bacterium]|nr:phosphoribosyl-ATP diphosphatase [Alphaproteobacteria bacterium]
MQDYLNVLYATIKARKNADPKESYVAALFQKGQKKIAQKVAEEAIETALAAGFGKKDELISESADLLFHLAILWADSNITPDEVIAELKRREGVSGHDEKRARQNQP